MAIKPKFWRGILLLAVMTTSAQADEVTLSADLWCPYTCDPTSEKKGILVEVVENILQTSGHTVDYELVNWARAVKSVRGGKHDGLIGAYISDAPDFVFHDSPIQTSKMCFFVKQDDPWEYKGTETLAERKISVINAYSYGETFDEYIQKNHHQGDRTIVQLSGMDVTEKRIEQIQTNQTDTVLEDWRVFPYNVSTFRAKHKAKDLGKFKNVGCLAGEGLYIALSPKRDTSKYYADLINQGLKQLEASGKLTEIIGRYE
ncbi:substrate-binding periplasmic protein [Vibrio ostreicida]|uniref:Transporter substrate-binding domain-containing protein n=1 Tax=Vibrio ostreicida TaxID=526588 RepID=A0ABT8BWD5_9VIBR|nr:transporter substrate-binding domain-containing protein [Vibrio ostreicida]MDN3611430.1 transporter substrate-binding domain-containing protein [Vibrio ostreicida]NPD08937.1 transporter substrate-binding domain-containing protein [Vibrio ostreicida]